MDSVSRWNHPAGGPRLASSAARVGHREVLQRLGFLSGLNIVSCARSGVELHGSFAEHQGGMALRSSNKSEPMLRVDSDGNRADLVLRDGTLKVAEAPPAPAE